MGLCGVSFPQVLQPFVSSLSPELSGPKVSYLESEVQINLYQQDFLVSLGTNVMPEPKGMNNLGKSGHFGKLTRRHDFD